VDVLILTIAITALLIDRLCGDWPRDHPCSSHFDAANGLDLVPPALPVEAPRLGFLA
jgi:hypothetical protein